MNRRQLLSHMALLTAGAWRHGYANHDMHASPQPAIPLLDTNALARYVTRLPIPSILPKSSLRPSPVQRGTQVPYYRVAMRQFQARVHPDMPVTTLWGYGATAPGPTFEVRRNEPILVEWVNELPSKHFLPIDHSIHGAEQDKPEVRTVVHLHGGRTPPDSDGYPESWFVPGQSALCYYPNGQEAATLFYHDHAMGITRLNAVAGLMGMYLIRDDFEDSLQLPRGRYEIPLVLFDRSFRRDGQVYYPPGPWVSEYYGSAILVNGTLFPYLEVEPRKYRFRVLNAANGSYYRLSFGTDVEFYLIGSEQGFLAASVGMSTLILGPGERADLIVDFSKHRGRTLLMQTEAAAFMQVRVASGQSKDDSSLPPTLRPIARTPESAAVRTRELTIGDSQDRLGRSGIMLLNGAHWDMPVTERPLLNSTEIWSFINLTDDSHPIHLPLGRFQVLDRRPFDLGVYQLTRQIVFTGPPDPLLPSELGWKDTVRVDPLTLTRIIVKFAGFPGRYVWHCHMLEHEDNEMMRPYEIVIQP